MSEIREEKKTALYELHLKEDARMVSFAGYLMPIQYSSIIKEHESVRQRAGVFDVSHMGQIMIQGPDSKSFLDYLLCNKIDNIKPGRMKYSPMLNEKGNILDDILVYCFNDEKFMLVVNASNTTKDYDWIIRVKKGNVDIKNISDEMSLIALQGPDSQKILSKFTNDLPVKYYSFKEEVEILSHKVLISRNGYTGEDGFEIYSNAQAITDIFKALLEEGVTPCGLGARDTLRLEAAMPLYGHEMSEEISPLDTSLEFFTKMDKPDFIGKDSLKDKNLCRIGLKNLDSGILRDGMSVYKDDLVVGKITSGTYLPTLKGSYAMAIVNKDYINKELESKIRDKNVKLEVVELPFYKRSK